MPDDNFVRAIGMSPTLLADRAEAAAETVPASVSAEGKPEPVFDFILRRL
jgi:hypothetical protein